MKCREVSKLALNISQELALVRERRERESCSLWVWVWVWVSTDLGSGWLRPLIRAHCPEIENVVKVASSIVLYSSPQRFWRSSNVAEHPGGW